MCKKVMGPTLDWNEIKNMVRVRSIILLIFNWMNTTIETRHTKIEYCPVINVFFWPYVFAVKELPKEAVALIKSSMKLAYSTFKLNSPFSLMFYSIMALNMLMNEIPENCWKNYKIIAFDVDRLSLFTK